MKNSLRIKELFKIAFAHDGVLTPLTAGRSAFVAMLQPTGLAAFLATILATGSLCWTSPVKAEDLMKDFDSLGGNDVLVERAKALNPDTKVSVVQDRIVSRRWRHELAPEFSSVAGGDAYMATQNLAMNYNLHISPHWSLGLKYQWSFNSLRPEGQHLIDDELQPGGRRLPEIDAPYRSYLAQINFYPIYGKMNFMDLGVVHFDLYALAGSGKVQLQSGMSNLLTAGGGVGLWWSQHLTTRAEVRYETYTAKRFEESTKMNLTLGSVQVGYML